MKANLIVGTNRSNSSTQWFLCPRFGDLRPLPVLFIGFVVNFTSAEISPILEINPLMFRGLLSRRGDIYVLFRSLKFRVQWKSALPAQFNLLWIR
jgi:hypothetical protein